MTFVPSITQTSASTTIKLITSTSQVAHTSGVTTFVSPPTSHFAPSSSTTNPDVTVSPSATITSLGTITSGSPQTGSSSALNASPPTGKIVAGLISALALLAALVLFLWYKRQRKSRFSILSVGIPYDEEGSQTRRPTSARAFRFLRRHPVQETPGAQGGILHESPNSVDPEASMTPTGYHTRQNDSVASVSLYRFTHPLPQLPSDEPLSRRTTFTGAYEEEKASRETPANTNPSETTDQIGVLQRQVQILMEENAILSGLPPPLYYQDA